MKKFALLVVSLFAAGSALYARKPAPVIPDFIHAAYSVESLLSEAELTNPGYDAFQFIYLMATPEWAGLDFDRPQDAVDAYATQFDYLKQGGKMALAPSMIEKAHAAGARILLCFGGQQEFLPLAGESGSDPQVCRVYGAPGRKERLRRHRHGLGDHAGQGVACPA